MSKFATRITMAFLILLYVASETPGIKSESGHSEFVISQSGISSWSDKVSNA